MSNKLIQSFLLRAAVCLLAAGTLFLSSCASQTGTIGDLSYDAKEQQIINQARAVGAAGGAAAGYLIGKNNDIGGLGGAALGALLGGVAGDAVGKNQAQNAQDVRLNNDQLREAIAITRENNDRLVAYNRSVATRIAEIRRKPKEEQSLLAKAELKDVKVSLKETEEYTDNRKASQAKMPESQASAYATEIRRGEREQTRLAGYRDELQKMSLTAN
jgi:hypothetical protein